MGWALPWSGPNLLGHLLVHADVTRNRNFVYGYDERKAGKGGDALASLRWTHFAAECTELLKAGTPLPDEIVVICDNCVGPSRCPALVSP